MREAMERLTALGFRFSIDHAETIDIDLPRLQDAGINAILVGETLMRAEDIGSKVDELLNPNES